MHNEREAYERGPTSERAAKVILNLSKGERLGELTELMNVSR